MTKYVERRDGEIVPDQRSDVVLEIPKGALWTLLISVAAFAISAAGSLYTTYLNQPRLEARVESIAERLENNTWSRKQQDDYVREQALRDDLTKEIIVGKIDAALLRFESAIQQTTAMNEGILQRLRVIEKQVLDFERRIDLIDHRVARSDRQQERSLP